MKKGIHPKWFEATISCACGAQYHTHATKRELKVEVCSTCHPFYTGQQRILDTGGQVDRFLRRLAVAEEHRRKSEEPEQSAEQKPTADTEAEPAG
jgi:large subunit ribosomal protein L31